MSDLDVVPMSDPAVISVPTAIYIHMVDLTQEGHVLMLHHINILQMLHYVDVSGWQRNSRWTYRQKRTRHVRTGHDKNNQAQLFEVMPAVFYFCCTVLW